MEETTPTAGGALARLKRIVVVAVILALAGTILFLLAERNSRFYYLSTEGSQLVVSRGANLPFGKRPWRPEDPVLAEAYAPVAIPAGVAPITEQRFGERQDLDRALFEVLAGWADARIRTDDPVLVREGLDYVARATRLQGVTAEQQLRLRGLRAELAWYEGRERLEAGGKLLEEARAQLQLATEASPARAREAVAILDDLTPAMERLTRALQTARGLRIAMPQAAPVPVQPAVAGAGGAGGSGGAGRAAAAGAGGAAAAEELAAPAP